MLQSGISAYPYNRKTSNSNTIPVHTFTKTLPRMLVVLKGYLTLRHETNQSIKMIIGYHRPRDRRLGSACEKCSSVASTGAGPGPLSCCSALRHSVPPRPARHQHGRLLLHIQNQVKAPQAHRQSGPLQVQSS